MNNRIKKIVGSQRFVAGLALIVLYFVFYSMSVPFRSFTTLTSIFDSSYYLGFLAIGVTVVIATGGIDLSLGTGMIAAGLTGGVLYERCGWPLWAALIVIVLFGILLGCFNGLLVAKFKMPPFIATLGTQMITLGYGSMVSKVQTVNFPLRSSPDGWYKSLFRTSENFPTGIIVLIIFAIIASVILSKTRSGRYVLALGSNEEATRLSGINTEKYKWYAYIFSGLCIGLAGIAYAATYTSVLPGEGMGIETNAIAGAIIGGTSMSGGVASIPGTLIGVFIMTVLQTGLPFIGFQPHYQTFITGFVIIGAVLVDVFKQNRKKQ